MALSTATISYDIADLVGTDYDERRTKVWVTTNVPDDTVIDTVGNAIRVGGGYGTIAADGTGSVVVWTPGTGSNPDTWQTYVHLDYASRATRQRVVRTFGPFTVTASANLADLVDEQEIPPTYLTTVTATLDAYADSAAAASTSAAASATSASASATLAGDYADLAVDLSGIATPDGVVEALINNPASDTSIALTEEIVGVTQPVLNIVAHGATLAAASAGIQAAHDALPASGGIIVIPVGDWECASTINITKECEIRGAGGANEFGNTRLRFASAVKGLNVDLPNSGDTFKLSDVALLSYSVAASAGKHGCQMKMGRMVLSNVSAYQFGDHGFFFDSTASDNVSHSVGILVRAYGNRGDGIRLEGTDSNMITLINPDVVANYGYGINNMGRHNLFLNPHADQQYNGAPGAYRDNNMSNRWEWVYEENSQEFLIDSSSSVGYVSFSTFGAPTITTSGTAHQGWEIVRTSGARNRLRTTNGTKQFEMGVGLIGSNTLDIANVTDGVNVVTIATDGTNSQWWGDLLPAADATRDLGWSGGRWRNAYFSGTVRVGTIFLRDNAGVLEKSTDGSSWSAV